MELEEIGHRIVGAAMEVHRELGPGLLESTYERCLGHELMLQGIKAERPKSQPINYKGLQIDDLTADPAVAGLTHTVREESFKPLMDTD